MIMDKWMVSPHVSLIQSKEVLDSSRTTNLDESLVPHASQPSPSFGRITKCSQRQSILQRAILWQQENVTYKFNAFHRGYRTQCSGYLAWAWAIPNPDPHRTPRCFDLEPRGLAIVISKDDLLPGDAMVCNTRKHPLIGKDKPNKAKGEQSGGHCLVFEQWTNESRTHYIGWEHCGDAVCRDVTHREIPYPYFYKQSCWEPMRYTNMTC